MLKNWVLLASVSYGVGFGSTLAISRNLQQSTLAGLTTVPAVAASMTLLSRQRKKEIDRQVAKLKSNLDELQQRKQLLQDQLQAKEDSSQEIEAKTAEKQYILEKINTELSRIETQRQLSIKAAKESNLALQNIDECISQRFLTKKQLDVEISDLQSQLHKLQTKVTHVEVDLRGLEYKISQAKEIDHQVAKLKSNLDELQQRKQLLQDQLQANKDSSQEIEAKTAEKQYILEKINTELSQIETQRQLSIKAAKESNLALQNIDECINQSFLTKQQLDIEISDLQSQLYKLQTKATHVEIDLRGVEYKISQAGQRERQILISIDSLEKSIEEKKSLLNFLNLKIIDRQEVSQQVSQLKEENRLSNIVDIPNQLLDVDEKQVEIVKSDPLTNSEEWSIYLINDPYLPILKHIEKHEVVTESEICNILGNARMVRQFAIKFREYFKYLPFSIKVESSNSGNRYVKEIISIIDSQALHLHDVSSLNTKEPELDLSEAELVTPAYDACRSCGRSPIPGQETCLHCN